ncbi:MAG: hypothetical protein GY734_01290, partial [Herbaspirillum sp.]|nr:hypothetical protein [Herbaspirillum sp.]
SPGGYVRSEYGTGLECDSECVWDIKAGETFAIRAVPDEGYSFDGWQGDVTGNISIVSVTMDAEKTVNAMFGDGGVTPQTHPLTVSVFPGGYIRSEYGEGLECDSECVWDIKAGETVMFEAVPDQGYRFESWQGDMTGNAGISSVTMNAAKTVKVLFAEEGVTPDTHPLTVLVSPGGHIRSEYGEGMECDSECV